MLNPNAASSERFHVLSAPFSRMQSNVHQYDDRPRRMPHDLIDSASIDGGFTGIRSAAASHARRPAGDCCAREIKRAPLAGKSNNDKEQIVVLAETGL